MKIYDCHIHAKGTTPDPVRLLEQMAEAGVYGGCIFSNRPLRYNGNAGTSLDDRIEELKLWTKDYEGRLIPVLWIHPYEANVVEYIRRAKDQGVRAFKIICNDFFIYESKCLKVLEEVAATGLPMFFHSGILYPSKEAYSLCSSQYNRPLHWEALINVPDLRFSMGHCSWPWIDECIALWGEVNSFRENGASTTQLFLDATPGAHGCYRDDLLKKIFTLKWGMENDVMFGRDTYADDYDVQWMKDLIAQDTAILNGLGVSEELQQQYFCGNLMRFLG